MIKFIRIFVTNLAHASLSKVRLTFYFKHREKEMRLKESGLFYIGKLKL